MSRIPCPYCNGSFNSLATHMEECSKAPKLIRTIKPSPKPRPKPTVVSQPEEGSVTHLNVVLPRSVTWERQKKWKASKGDEWRKHRAEYMKKYREGK